jgi:hypothetical protein
MIENHMEHANKIKIVRIDGVRACEAPMVSGNGLMSGSLQTVIQIEAATRG